MRPPGRFLVWSIHFCRSLSPPEQPAALGVAAQHVLDVEPGQHDRADLPGERPLVLHGAVSADLFVDCNGEGFFLLAKFAHILDAIREKTPTFLGKTTELVNRFAAAAQRYEVTLKRVEASRSSRKPN